MKNIDDLVQLLNEYPDAIELKDQRLNYWNDSGFDLVKRTLEQTAKEIKDNIPFFAASLQVGADDGGYMDEKDRLWQSKKLRKVYLRSGPILRVHYEAEGGAKQKKLESGIDVTFGPMLNGKIYITSTEHGKIDNETVNVHTIALVEPEDLTPAVIIDYVHQAVKKIKSTSHLFK